MKNYLMLATAVTLSLNAAEQPMRTPREWMAKEYSEGNDFQISFFSHCLQKWKIPIEDQDVITFGCGTGKLESKLIEIARSVHGIDASSNMINFATHRYINPANTGRLSFEHCYAEDFKPKKPFKIALAPCSFHWFEDKKKALSAIRNSLGEEGIFFANIETTSNSKAFGLTVFEDMKQDIPLIGRLLDMLPNPTGSSHPSIAELHVMFDEAGFEMLEGRIETYDWTATEEGWRKYQLPLLLSTPGAQTIINSTSADCWVGNKASTTAFWFINMTPEQRAQHNAPFFPGSTDPLIQKIRDNDFCRYLFNDFLNRCLKKMKYNPDTKTYTWTFETTMILARKR